MDQEKKFNRKRAGWGIKPLLGVFLSLCASPSLLAAVPSVQPRLEKNQGDLEKPVVVDRLAPVKARLAEQYSDVRHLSIEDYLSDYPEAVLVDVRAADEYAVSRIPGAVHIEGRAELLAFARQHSNSQLILYCSVGARSAEAARFLQEQSQTQDIMAEENVGEVANLAGSIFEWANENRPLENDAGATTEVHPFNAWWGWRYLKKR